MKTNETENDNLPTVPEPAEFNKIFEFCYNLII